MFPAKLPLDLHTLSLPSLQTPKITLTGAERYCSTGTTIAGSGDKVHESRLSAVRPFKIPISRVTELTELGLGLI
jgi:hypothetical protein